MNLVDIVILVVLGVFLLKGVLRGLLKEVCSLLGIVCGGLLAFYLHLPLAQWIMDLLQWPSQLCVTLAFLVVFISVIVIFGALGYLLNRVVTLPLLGGLNRLTGAFFGFLQGVILLALILFALQSADLPNGVRRQVQDSELSPPFARLGESIFLTSRELARH